MAQPRKPAFERFEASLLACPQCRRAVPVRKRLLLVLPEGDKVSVRLSGLWQRVRHLVPSFFDPVSINGINELSMNCTKKKISFSNNPRTEVKQRLLPPPITFMQIMWMKILRMKKTTTPI